MPAEHDRGRIARRKETFRPVQNRVHIPIRGFLGRHRATHRHIEILLPSDKRAIGATEGYIQRIDGSATHVERHRGELLLFALAQTLRVLADTQRAETRRFADGTQQREPILVYIGGIRNEHVVIAFRTQQLSNPAPSPPTSPRRTPEPSRKAAYMRAQPAPANQHRRTAAPRIHETRAAHNPRHCPCRTPFRWPTHPTESIMLRCGQPADRGIIQSIASVVQRPLCRLGSHGSS